MKVRAIFKGVTYESLKDPEFVRVAREKLPLIEALYKESTAARATQDGLFAERTRSRN